MNRPLSQYYRKLQKGFLPQIATLLKSELHASHIYAFPRMTPVSEVTGGKALLHIRRSWTLPQQQPLPLKNVEQLNSQSRLQLPNLSSDLPSLQDLGHKGIFPLLRVGGAPVTICLFGHWCPRPVWRGYKIEFKTPKPSLPSSLKSTNHCSRTVKLANFSKPSLVPGIVMPVPQA